jgi:fucose 4-O-acetylase-like acetyltransferase
MRSLLVDARKCLNIVALQKCFVRLGAHTLVVEIMHHLVWGKLTPGLGRVTVSTCPNTVASPGVADVINLNALD